MYRGNFQLIDRWTPTSQTCFYCDFQGGKKEFNMREWTCLNCATFHHRDVNAAVHIFNVAGGHFETGNGRGGGRKTISKVAASFLSVNLPGI